MEGVEGFGNPFFQCGINVTMKEDLPSCFRIPCFFNKERDSSMEGVSALSTRRGIMLHSLYSRFFYLYCDPLRKGSLFKDIQVLQCLLAPSSERGRVQDRSSAMVMTGENFLTIYLSPESATAGSSSLSWP